MRFETTPQGCVRMRRRSGLIETRTPLLEKPISGGVYVAKPFDNPFGSLLAMYLAIEEQETWDRREARGQGEAGPGDRPADGDVPGKPRVADREISRCISSAVRGRRVDDAARVWERARSARCYAVDDPEGADVDLTYSFLDLLWSSRV